MRHLSAASGPSLQFAQCGEVWQKTVLFRRRPPCYDEQHSAYAVEVRPTTALFRCRPPCYDETTLCQCGGCSVEVGNDLQPVSVQ